VNSATQDGFPPPRNRRHNAAARASGAPRPKAGLLFRSYLLAVLAGLKNTLKHLFKIGRHKTFTLEYPEKRLPVRKGYRGEHRLKRDELGREKCVACFMCQTICPAHCIRIIAEEAPWSDRDKRPKVFEIDMLRCIYCGMCEEACPCDAIELTETYNIVATSRVAKVYDKQKLLSR
jgi:NADH-quinone oxidoreductase subunit I